jgi:peroxiredoxin
LAVFIFIGGFIFFQYKEAIFNPKLNISSPKENQTIIGTDLEIKGSTDSNSTVYVDDELVSVDDFGNFKKIITVFPGKTTVVIKSSNRFGKQSEVERHINVKPGY